MKGESAALKFDDLEVPDESSAAISAGARRPRELIPRDRLEALSARSDLQGILYLTAHFAAIASTAWLLYLATPGWWALPALLLHGIVVSYLFSPMHECSHYSAFRTPWLNEAAYWVVCAVYLMVPYWFRYLHLSHHRYTQIRGKDPELVLATPSNARKWLWYVSGIPFWWRNVSRILRHATLGPDPEDIRGGMYVPRHKYGRLMREARVAIAFHAAVWTVAIAYGFGWWLLWLWIVPRIVGEPLQRMFRVAEHTSCAENAELLHNTRTTLTNAPLRYLGWQMCFHAEHHLFPNVPFHRLPRVHELIHDRLSHVERRGYLRGHIDIVAGLSAREQSSGAAAAVR